jgi:hypothetical protein
MTEMREKIALALAACASRHIWGSWETEADAVMALIGPVMEDNERLLEAATKAKACLEAGIGDHPAAAIHKVNKAWHILTATLSTKSEPHVKEGSREPASHC